MYKRYYLLIIIVVVVGCGDGGGTSDANASAPEGQSERISNELNLREKVYQQLVSEQLLFDSLSLVRDSTGRDTLIDCGTRLTMEQFDIISKHQDLVCQPEEVPADTNTILNYPIRFYIVAKRTNNGAITRNEVRQSFEDMQLKYNPAKIRFVLRGIDTIQSDDFYDFKKNFESRVVRRGKINEISVFIFNSITTDLGRLNGYAKMSARLDFIMMTGDAMRNLTTFPHEMGHYFFLYHTHGKTVLPTDELVSRDNCSCSGDDVCDTPADPDLFDQPLPGCVYSGNQTDKAGNVFTPDPFNLMSYATACRNRFTKGQYNRIRYFALNLRDNLLEGNN